MQITRSAFLNLLNSDVDLNTKNKNDPQILFFKYVPNIRAVKEKREIGGLFDYSFNVGKSF